MLSFWNLRNEDDKSLSFIFPIGRNDNPELD